MLGSAAPAPAAGSPAATVLKNGAACSTNGPTTHSGHADRSGSYWRSPKGHNTKETTQASNAAPCAYLSLAAIASFSAASHRAATAPPKAEVPDAPMVGGHRLSRVLPPHSNPAGVAARSRPAEVAHNNPVHYRETCSTLGQQARETDHRPPRRRRWPDRTTAQRWQQVPAGGCRKPTI